MFGSISRICVGREGCAISLLLNLATSSWRMCGCVYLFSYGLFPFVSFQPSTASNLRKPVSTSLIQHHQAVESNGFALRPLSPGSCGSSMEVSNYVSLFV